MRPISVRILPFCQLMSSFKTNPIHCTLLARWDDSYVAPWLILTDLDSTDAEVSWYGFRSWSECSYRDIKSDGFWWHKTRLQQPDRAERHWLAMAVAMLWMVTLGGEQEFAALVTEALGDRQPQSHESHFISIFYSFYFLFS